jgi:mannan endo-1,4-beta-mannosidase
MYDFMTNVYPMLPGRRPLTNVIWVFAPHYGRGPAFTCFLYNPTADDYYPGGDVVDIVGLDAYLYEPESDVCLGTDYAALTALGKPFAFTEIGRSDTVNTSKMDYRKWVKAIKNRFQRTTYFVAWNDHNAPQANNFYVEFMNDPVVTNRGDSR